MGSAIIRFSPGALCMNFERDIQRERLFYIEYLALFTGLVSRKDLVSRFGISEPAATKDLSLYAERAPGVLRYDLRQKTYVYAGGDLLFAHDVDQSLYSLAGERAIAIDAAHAKRLPAWVNASIKRKVPVPLVASITRCLYQRRQMTAEYFSLTSGSRERLLSPVALVNDGLRWHVRCFLHEKKEFRDYNLTRFTSVEERGTSDATLEQDDKWNQEVRLKLVPHPRADHPETIALDYGMSENVKYVTLRSCLVGYFLRHWHIDYSDDASGNPKAEQLFLANKRELQVAVPKWSFEP